MSNLDEALRGLHVYAWEVASRSRHDLAVLHAEVEDVAGEVALLSTCQRLELVALGPQTVPEARVLVGRPALQHLAEVASGLHSLVLGEAEVLGQVRGVAADAPRRIHALLNVAIAAARALRRELPAERHTGEALDYGLTLAELQPQGRLLVLGAGPAGRRVAQRAHELGFEVLVASRREPLTLQPGTSFVPLHEIAALSNIDVLVTCLGAAAPELAVDELPPVRSLVLDLGTPRNVRPDPSLPLLLDMATLLASQREEPAAERLRLRARLSELVDRHLERVQTDGTSTLGLLYSRVESVRQREMERSLRLHPELAPATLDQVTRSLVNQILHAPAMKLRRLADPALAQEFVSLFAGETPAEDEEETL